MLAVKIVITGKIDKEWCQWLGGLAVNHTGPDQAVLTGILPDQAALYGVIARLRDLGVPLLSVSVTPVEK